MANALELTNVTKHYGGFTLDHISITLPEGCVMGFIGENGAGKSTTIRAILDLIHLDEGSIRVFGEPLSRKNRALKEHIGVVFDESSFPENICIKNINVIMKNCYATWNHEKFFQYVKQFDLPESRPIKEYSRGMKMKLSIAVALSHDSRLLILDEATSGLDPVVRDEILDVFLEFMQDEHHSIFISSHILSDLEKLCDYITFVHKGKLVFSQTKESLQDQYAMVRCTKEDLEELPPSAIVGVREYGCGVEALCRRQQMPEGVQLDPASIEDIMVYFVKEKKR